MGSTGYNTFLPNGQKFNVRRATIGDSSQMSRAGGEMMRTLQGFSRNGSQEESYAPTKNAVAASKDLRKKIFH